MCLERGTPDGLRHSRRGPRARAAQPALRTLAAVGVIGYTFDVVRGRSSSWPLVFALPAPPSEDGAPNPSKHGRGDYWFGESLSD
jgi:hypothetical protein